MAQGATTDPKRLKEAEQKGKLGREQELRDLQLVLGLEAGRRVLWRLMQRAGVFKSVWEASAKIHYNAGTQDFGHFLMAEIVEAEQEALFLMMKESKQREDNPNA